MLILKRVIVFCNPKSLRAFYVLKDTMVASNRSFQNDLGFSKVGTASYSSTGAPSTKAFFGEEGRNKITIKSQTAFEAVLNWVLH